MKLNRLREILSEFPRVSLIVLGDFFLDQYLITDPALDETSLETGLTAHQVVDIRCSPGAAGTVSSNLAALGVGRIEALGIIGADGHGYELKKGLRERGIRTDLLIETAERRTPTYTKPMRRLAHGSEVEIERLDIKNRTATPSVFEDALIHRLECALTQNHGVIVGDQVPEEDCGVVTGRVRTALAGLAAQYSRKIFFADSRARIGRFRNIMIKPNQKEAAAALPHPVADQMQLLRELHRGCGRPVFLTKGEQGIVVYDGLEARHAPAVPVTGPIDIVGAGDSATAGIVAALAVGATPLEAAEMGNLVASVTIRKLGTTGTASPDEVIQAAQSAGMT